MTAVAQLHAEARPLPHNHKAEQMLLGAILSDNGVLGPISETLRAEHFADDRHGRLYAAMLSFHEAGFSIDPPLLADHFKAVSDDALGSKYLAELAGAGITRINAPDYARTITDYWMRRRLIELAEEIARRAYGHADLDDDAFTQLTDAEAELLAMGAAAPAHGGFRPLDAAAVEAIEEVEAAYKRGGGPAGLLTGLYDLDALLGGLRRGWVYVVGGRPSMGKSALALTICLRADTATGLFSPEMSAVEQAYRALSSHTGYPVNALVNGALDRYGDMATVFRPIVEAPTAIAAARVHVDDTASLTPAIVRNRALRLKRSHDIGLLVIDYLQLMQGDRKHDNRVAEVTEIFNGVKRLARELDIPVLLIS